MLNNIMAGNFDGVLNKEAENLSYRVVQPEPGKYIAITFCIN